MSIQSTIVATIASLGISSVTFAQVVADFFPGQNVTAYDAAAQDEFGESVALDGNYAIIGSDNDDTFMGCAYIFERQAGGDWNQVQRLISTERAEGDFFGCSVAISGDLAVVGARGEDGSSTNSGAIYIFERQFNGTWEQVARLTGDDTGSGDQLGCSVAISGELVLAGAKSHFVSGTRAGSAYLFERSISGNWSQALEFNAPVIVENAEFGSAVVLEGTTALIGAHSDLHDGARTGSAYVFQLLDNGLWSSPITLNASDGSDGDRFGYSLGLSGDCAVISAYYSTADATNSGSAYVFDLQADGTWEETAKLTASDADTSDFFAKTTAIEGDIILVGAYADNDNGPNSGSAYMFQKRSDGSWYEAHKFIHPNGDEYQSYGHKVAIFDNTAMISVYRDNDPDIGAGTGSVFFHDIYNAINLDYNNRPYTTLSAAIADALSDENLAVRSDAFDLSGIIDATQNRLNFIAVEPINIHDELMFLPGSGSAFLESNDVAEAGWLLSGRLIAPSDGSLLFNSIDTGTGGQLHQNDCSLLVNGPMQNSGGVNYLSDEILAMEVATGANGVNRVIRETEVLGDYLNDGTTVVHRGTLYIYGDLNGGGTMLGDVDTGPGRSGGEPPAPGDGFAIGGSSALGADASLRMLDFDWTLGIGGDADWAINANDRFAMSGATIELTGLNTGLQSLELMSLDMGADAVG
ncbi:MAG: FG-GAP repeat protein, partial [Phycisphaerales bacterium]|nr:FG-GAP repeat protein [Phycisphaerales bacterium]